MTAERPRLTMRPGRSATAKQRARSTRVEFPFTEARPSLAGPAAAALRDCQAQIAPLTPHQQAVVLANLCSLFGEHDGHEPT